MRRNLTTLFTIVAVNLLAVASAFAHDGYNHPPKPAPVCTVGELKGEYSFRLSGDVFKPIDQDGHFGPNSDWDDRDASRKLSPMIFKGVAEVTFDGNGNFTSEDEIVLEGKPVASFASSKGTGVYIVNSDCTGSLYLQSGDRILPLDIDIVVSDTGREIFAVINSCGQDRRHGILGVEGVGRKNFVRHFDDED